MEKDQNQRGQGMAEERMQRLPAEQLFQKELDALTKKHVDTIDELYKHKECGGAI